MDQHIRSRQVTYFHGFDPASTQRYRRIFEASANRLAISVQDLPGKDEGWRAIRGRTITDVHMARYAEHVRAFQNASMLARLGRGMRSLFGYLADGSGLRIARRAPRAALLALSPVLATLLPFTVISAVLQPSGPIQLGILLALGAGLLMLAKSAFLLLVADLFAFFRTLAAGTSPAAEDYRASMDGLSAAISDTPTDERLIVGHSLGGIAAILATSRLLDRLPDDASLSLLTLGSNHGLILLQQGQGKDALSDAIAKITSDPRVYWVDVSSPRDAFCVPLTDPLLLMQADSSMRSPRMLSAQITKAQKIPGDRRTVFAAMRRHMGYLLAPTQDGAFDYVATITGGRSLEGRYAQRANSPKARMWHG